MTRSLTDPWTLGGVPLENRVVLAPLAGIGNWFVRLQARRFGAGLVVSEMVSSFGLAYGNERTVREFLRIHPDEHPVSVQLFGHDPAIMREAAAMAAEAGADLIDLNMGCPVRKVCKTGAGAALLDDPGRARGARSRSGRGQRASGDGEAAARAPAGRPRGRRPRPQARRRRRRGGHRLPSPPRLPAARRPARLCAGRPPGRRAVRAGAALRRPLRRCGRAGRLRGERRRRGDAGARLARQPVALRAPARPLRGRARPRRGCGRAELGDRVRRGPPRRGARGPLPAQVLPLVRRHDGPHQAPARAARDGPHHHRSPRPLWPPSVGARSPWRPDGPLLHCAVPPTGRRRVFL